MIFGWFFIRSDPIPGPFHWNGSGSLKWNGSTRIRNTGHKRNTLTPLSNVLTEWVSDWRTNRVMKSFAFKKLFAVETFRLSSLLTASRTRAWLASGPSVASTHSTSSSSSVPFSSSCPRQVNNILIDLNSRVLVFLANFLIPSDLYFKGFSVRICIQRWGSGRIRWFLVIRIRYFFHRFRILPVTTDI